MNSSASRRISPPRADILTILYNAGYSRITTRIRKHLRTTSSIVLRIILSKRNSVGVVIVAGLLAIGTPWLCIDYNRQVGYLLNADSLAM
jgi:hypothetical protein